MTMNAGKGVGKGELLFPAGGNANLCSHCGNQCEDASKNLKTEIAHDTALPLLHLHWKDPKSTYIVLAHPCLLLHYWQWPGNGTILDTHQDMSG